MIGPAEQKGLENDLVQDLYRLTSDLVLLKHRATDRPVLAGAMPYLLAGLALTAELAVQTLQDNLPSTDADYDGLDDHRLLHSSRVYRAWHILETLERRPWIASELSAPTTVNPSTLQTQSGIDQAMEDLLELETSRLNQLHTEVVLIDEGGSL